MRILRPATLTEALAALRDPAAAAAAVAGGTAHQLQWSQGKPRPELLVEIGPLLPAGILPDYSANNRLPPPGATPSDFSQKNRAGSLIRIGAATTLDALHHANLPLLSQAAADVAAPGIRRLATLGGSIGWGAGCLLPALLALDAQLDTTGGPVALADWLTAPSGLILAIELAAPPPTAHLVWRKIGLRAGFSPAILTLAAVMTRTEGRIATLSLAVGGGIVPPQRLTTAEAQLIGTPPNAAAIEAAVAAAFSPPACPLRSASFRRRVAARALAQGLAPRAAAPPQPRLHLASTTPPLPPLTRHSPRWHNRPDMETKVAGTLPYLTDTRRPDMLVGRILRAAHPHARILAIDTAAAEALPGVAAVVTHRDVPGLNAFGILFPDQPALCHDKVRHLGDPVAAVAACDDATAEAALALIRVTYAPLPVVTDAEAALAPEAPPIHDNCNLITDLGLTRGDPDAAFATAAHVVEDIYVTPRQMHGFLETEGGHAELLPDGTLLVAVGGQHGARDRSQLARILNRPERSIRVITSPTGGAFGGKDELTVQPALALLALKAGAPVRLQLSRAESVRAGIKRNPMRLHLRSACDAEGRLLAQEVTVIADAGAYASLSPGVLETAMEHAAGPYVIPNIRTRGRLAYTNNGICGAFRGFGANQMAYAVECQIDRLAAACGLDPAEMRRRNLRIPGSPGFLGQRVAPSERLAEMLTAAAGSPLWQPVTDDGEWITGTGMALMWQGNGLGTLPTDEAEGTLRLTPDGAVEVLCGLDEMGQGLLAALQASVADRLGIARADVRPVTGDTGCTPDSGSTTASRGGYVVWTIAQNTAPGFTAQLLAGAARLTGLPPEALRLVPGGVAEIARNLPDPLVRFADLAHALHPQGLPVETTAFAFPKTEYTKGNARFIFCAGATVARVAASRVTGALRVTDLHLHTAAGPVIDLAAYLGQMEGGAVQGLGFTLSEDILMQGGRMLTANLDTYAMPTILDAPDRMQITALETLDAGDPYGPRGAGELGIGGVTPAICNAVADALGRWPTVTPIPPETILTFAETARGATP
ncbi:xanthine dehydrogenase D subunit [Gemmobacter aquatilis]|uniref:Xanthine dehydrogenase D subunit n=1 Tax=Gemmobacter aquatilis TaxID=933059 RepID=A0A1H8BNC5_9RHOB|nr:molybdopterin cofactor-binding domain-containing protein [Gemmobacter aquatilis]SEM84401.1 xanthine dehydrogenase D subunit [Gemmobacter aquatilis]